MENIILIFQVLTGIFAIYGVCEFIRRFIDMYVISKSGAVCKIVLESCDDDAEYIVRFAESRLLSGDYADFFNKIEISDCVDIDNETFEKLDTEFGNISSPLSHLR